ncbi:hypothetical protein VP01_570g3 [Puccinia sorghi]|uniref:RRM domain-containing protein n=1 Tax=Puccinia sorghi TaxID=27349 RepID=A0A0L6UIL7_9BASI|nr:hypothetical protein VP01_570g3 [Puccinia sorghi]
MLDQLFLHLAQYADEIKNSSKPSLECTLFKSLEKMEISHTNEPSLTAEYRTSSPIDFSPPSPTEGGHSSSSLPSGELDPVDCLRYSSEFHFPQCCPAPHSTPPFFPFELPHMTNKFEAFDSVAGSSVYASSEETDPFCISSQEHSRISSDNWAAEGACQLKSFDPFADPLFYLPFRPRGGNRQNVMGASSTSEKPHQNQFAGGGSNSIIPDMDPAALIPPTNVFVANFPSHWSKSDLWDLFEGISVTTVGFFLSLTCPCYAREANYKRRDHIWGYRLCEVNTGIARASDAHALLAMLDKKIWLIDGSALKFRLANSSPPTEPINFHVPKNNRTVRRHQHKVIDRLRAEQTVGNKQLACCDRHQIVVYQNVPSGSRRSEGSPLSVVHGSRQRNSNFVCNATESSLAACAPQRPFLEFLKTYLNRRNHYNGQQMVTPSLKQSPVQVFSPVPLHEATSKMLEQAGNLMLPRPKPMLPLPNPMLHGPNPMLQGPNAMVQRPNPLLQMPNILQPHTSPHAGAYFRAMEIPRGVDIFAPSIPYAASTPHYPWPSDAPVDARICGQANAPPFSLRWVPASYPTYPQVQYSQPRHIRAKSG